MIYAARLESVDHFYYDDDSEMIGSGARVQDLGKNQLLEPQGVKQPKLIIQRARHDHTERRSHEPTYLRHPDKVLCQEDA